MTQFRPALFVLCLLLLAGCGTSRPTDFYLLDSQATRLNVMHMPRATMALESVVLPGYLDRNNIVIRDINGASLAVASFSVWAEPLRLGIQRVLTDMLTAPLLHSGVTVLPWQNPAIASSSSLYVEVLRLDATQDGLVCLEARWTAVDKNAQRVLDRGSFSAEEKIEMPPFGTKAMFDAVVAAESRLVQQFGRELAAQLPQSLAGLRTPSAN